MMGTFNIGLDLGQSNDYTALAIIETVKLPVGEPHLDFKRMEHSVVEQWIQDTRTEYHLRHLERPELGTPYPAIVQHVCTLVEGAPLNGEGCLVIDHTGVGRPVVDLFRDADLRTKVIPVTITGGDSVTWENGGYRVPKRDLVTALQVLFQQQDFKIADGLPHMNTLIAELLNFKAKISLSGHDSYEAGGSGAAGEWREGAHDDLVLAVALAVWHAVREERHGNVWGLLDY
jgi:hypothetical protein